MPSVADAVRVPFVASAVSLYSTTSGLSCGIGGYDQWQETLLSAILAQMRSLRALDKPADFARLKEAMKRGLSNYPLEQPYQHAATDEVRALEETLWTHEEKLRVLDGLTPAHVDEFSSRLLQAAEIDLFVHGNVEERSVRATAELVQRALNLRPLEKSQPPRSRVV